METVLRDSLIRYEGDVKVLRVVSDPLRVGISSEVFLEQVAQSLLGLGVELGIDRVSLAELKRLVSTHDRSDGVVGSCDFCASSGLYPIGVDVRLGIAYSRTIGVPDGLSIVSRRLDPLDGHSPCHDDVFGECTALFTEAVTIIGKARLIEGSVVDATHCVGDPLIPRVDEVVLDAEARGRHTIRAKETSSREVDIPLELQGI